MLQLELDDMEQETLAAFDQLSVRLEDRGQPYGSSRLSRRAQHQDQVIQQIRGKFDRPAATAH